jgi:hypothetical protein
MFFGGLHGVVMSMFDLHVPDSAPTHYDTMVWAITRSRRSLLLASGSWTPTRPGLRSSMRSVPTLMLLLAPTFMEDYYTVISHSTPAAGSIAKLCERVYRGWSFPNRLYPSVRCYPNLPFPELGGHRLVRTGAPETCFPVSAPPPTVDRLSTTRLHMSLST